MLFDTKSYLKNNRYHTPKHPFNNKWIQEMGFVSIHENGNITHKTIEKQQKPIY